MESIHNGNGWNLIFAPFNWVPLQVVASTVTVLVVVVRCWEMCLVRGSVHDWAGELLQWARQPSVQQPGTAESGDAIFTFLVHSHSTVQLYTSQTTVHCDSSYDVDNNI